MKPIAAAIICKTPAAGKSKTRLSPPLAPDECAEISACFIRDLSATINALAEDGDVAPCAVYTPHGSETDAAASAAGRPSTCFCKARAISAPVCSKAPPTFSPPAMPARFWSIRTRRLCRRRFCARRSMPCGRATMWCSAPPSTAAIRWSACRGRMPVCSRTFPGAPSEVYRLTLERAARDRPAGRQRAGLVRRR